MAKKDPIGKNLLNELRDERRGFNAPALAKYVLQHGLIAELTGFALSKEALLSSRAAWVLGHCSELNYDSLKLCHDKLIKNLVAKNLHKGVIRNTLRLYQTKPPPKKHDAFLLDTCYSYIKDQSEAVAIRAFAVTVIFNISKPYPELLQELAEVLRHMNSDEEFPAIRSRIKHTLNRIHMLLKT